MTDAIRGVVGTGGAAGINPSGGTKTGQTTSAAAPTSASGGSDSANVSQTQSLLETINATAAAIPIVNQGQVSAIRQAIANGTYQVDPQQVAKQLLNSDQALVGPASGNE
jgi:negative regulator of flagellin synthesis FlgM